MPTSRIRESAARCSAAQSCDAARLNTDSRRSGAGIINTLYGLPDLGFITLGDLAQHTALTRDAVDIRIIVDADTGFGNELNVRHTIRTLERAGANAIQLED